MSREELERIASGVDEIIDAEPVEEDEHDGQEQGHSDQPNSGSSADENIDSGVGSGDEQLDLGSVPEHRHQEAVMDHFFRVMSENVMDKEVGRGAERHSRNENQEAA